MTPWPQPKPQSNPKLEFFFHFGSVAVETEACFILFCCTDDASELGPCVLSSQERPTSAAILDALNTAKPAMEARARELEGKGDGSKQWWER